MLVRLIPLLLIVPALPFGASAAAPAHVSVHQDYAAGQWVVLWVTFSEVTDAVSFSGNFAIRTASPVGEPVHLFAMPPSIMVTRNGVDDILDSFETPRVEANALGGELSREASLGATTWTSGIRGVILGFAASHPWRLDLELDVAGPVDAHAGPAYVMDGATFASAQPLTTPVAGVQQFTYQIPDTGYGSWTHLSTESTHLQPAGVRSYDIRFPHGPRFTGTGQMLGANAVLVGLYSSNNYWGGFGSTTTGHGQLTARIQYEETSLGAGLHLVHMPYPAGFGTTVHANYRTFDAGFDL